MRERTTLQATEMVQKCSQECCQENKAVHCSDQETETQPQKGSPFGSGNRAGLKRAQRKQTLKLRVSENPSAAAWLRLEKEWSLDYKLDYLWGQLLLEEASALDWKTLE